MNGKQLIERQETYSKVANGHDYVLLDGKAHRICAPEDEQCYAIILWNKDSPSDNSPSTDKIVHCLNLFLPIKNANLVYYLVWWAHLQPPILYSEIEL